jgi:hypothetical protein
MSNWTKVCVRTKGSANNLLKNGKGYGGLKYFVCGKFEVNKMPVVGERYEISGLEEHDVFDFDFKLLCTYSGEISSFIKIGIDEEE